MGQRGQMDGLPLAPPCRACRAEPNCGAVGYSVSFRSEGITPLFCGGEYVYFS